MKAVTLHNKEFEMILSTSQVDGAVTKMASAIDAHYNGMEITAICVLKGAFIFFSDLVKKLQTPTEVEFIRVSSYADMQSGGEVKEVAGITFDPNGRHLLVVDDILDTGKTNKWLRDYLNAKKPASLAFAHLLYKPSAVVNGEKPDFFGFEIENKFVVGYGLDYNQLGRTLPEIYQLKI